MEVIGIILFCLISIWLGVGSSWLIICESKSYKPKPSITKQKMDKFETMVQTYEHKQNVNIYINSIIRDLLSRGILHDNSKLVSPEVEIFAEYTPKLAKSTYGSDEYKGFLKEMGVALEHHYKNNRHHPEYFDNGLKGMTLVDLVEMLCDWKAATLRHNDGDILKSIELNQKRFGYTDELKQIFINTVETYF